MWMTSPRRELCANTQLRLHAQLSRITARVWLCYSIKQLQWSKYMCQWENWITGRSMSYPVTLGGAVPISIIGNRAPPPADLFTSPAAVRRARRSSSLYISYMVYMIITQTRCTMAFLLILVESRRRPSTSGSQPREKNLKPAQNAIIRSDLMECIHAGVMQLSIE